MMLQGFDKDTKQCLQKGGSSLITPEKQASFLKIILVTELLWVKGSWITSTNQGFLCFCNPQLYLILNKMSGKDIFYSSLPFKGKQHGVYHHWNLPLKSALHTHYLQFSDLVFFSTKEVSINGWKVKEDRDTRNKWETFFSPKSYRKLVPSVLMFRMIWLVTVSSLSTFYWKALPWAASTNSSVLYCFKRLLNGAASTCEHNTSQKTIYLTKGSCTF